MADDVPPIPEHVLPYLAPGTHTYNTPLSPQQEAEFKTWVVQNKVPFEADKLVTDYDMRGFWQALQARDPKAMAGYNLNDGQMHYPDWWKTPYHQTFSNESQWATPQAPGWNQSDQLVDQAGNILHDERGRRGGGK